MARRVSEWVRRVAKITNIHAYCAKIADGRVNGRKDGRKDGCADGARIAEWQLAVRKRSSEPDGVYNEFLQVRKSCDCGPEVGNPMEGTFEEV